MRKVFEFAKYYLFIILIAVIEICLIAGIPYLIYVALGSPFISIFLAVTGFAASLYYISYKF